MATWDEKLESDGAKTGKPKAEQTTKEVVGDPPSSAFARPAHQNEPPLPATLPAGLKRHLDREALRAARNLAPAGPPLQRAAVCGRSTGYEYLPYNTQRIIMYLANSPSALRFFFRPLLGCPRRCLAWIPR